MFDIDYLTDSMNYIPVSLENQTNPHAGTSEVTNSAGTLQTPNANASEEEDEAEELIVVPTAVRHTASKVGPRKSSTNSKAEEFLTELQNLKTQEKEAYSTGILEDTPEILAFRRELDELAPKHLREVPKNKATSTTSVNSGSGLVNTQHADQDDSDMPELTIFNKPQKGIFDEASYDDEGMVHDFNNLPTEVAVSPIPTLRIHNIHPQSQILGDPKSSVQTRSRVQQNSGAHALEEPKKISEALKDDSWVEAMQEELLQFRLQQLSDEEVYVSQPPGFVDPDHPKKCFIRCQALYGQHQALYSWKYHAGSSVVDDIIFGSTRKIFKYLKGKPNLGLWYPRESSFDLEAYSDSDYAGANLDRKSTTGGCQFLGSRLISWQCKKQTIVATSTTEAEYVAAASCCGQVLWIQNQMLDYGFNFINTKIHINNESTIYIVKNPVYHSKTKHIEIRHHFIRDSYEKKLIRVEKIHTDFNVADLLTKAFDGPRFNFLVVNIVILDCNEVIGAWIKVELKLCKSSLWYCHNLISGSFLLNPTATTSTLADGTLELRATIDTLECTITEACVRSKLQLADASGIFMLPNTEIFEGMGNMGYPANVVVDQSAGPADQAEDQPSSSAPLPSSSHPPVISITIASEPTHVAEPTTQHSSPSPEPDNEPTEHIFEQPSPEHQPLSPRQETEVPHSQDPTHPHVPEARTIIVEDLLHLVPNLITKVDSLETELKQTKLTMGKAIVKLVKKVKKLEAILKRRHVVLTDSEDEEPED
ncbi:hypothetical protein Tco_1188431 [Tanacetum coccineum]